MFERFVAQVAPLISQQRIQSNKCYFNRTCVNGAPHGQYDTIDIKLEIYIFSLHNVVTIRLLVSPTGLELYIYVLITLARNKLSITLYDVSIP